MNDQKDFKTVLQIITSAARPDYTVTTNGNSFVIGPRKAAPVVAPAPGTMARVSRRYSNAELRARRIRLCKVHGRLFRDDPAAMCLLCAEEGIRAPAKA